MVRKIVSAVAVVLLPALIASSADAQTITIQPGGAGEGSGARISALRVQTQMNLFLPGSVAGSVDEQKSISSKARRALYEMATRECQILVEVFRADCRLVSVNVNSNVQARVPGQGSEGVNASGTVTYELTARPN